MDKEQLIEVLKKCDYATICLAIGEHLKCDVIDSNKLETIHQALYDELGDERWKLEYEL